MQLRWLALVIPALLLGCEPGESPPNGPAGIRIDRNVAVPMRDGVVLRANVWRPASGGPFPVLVYRTPYGKDATEEWYTTHLHAVDRGYAVVLQDVRGRYESDGEFDPYRNEGRDGYDTIEWAAVQPWSNGSVGTFGLSYPGAVQWLAALESPPHLKAMVPAMTFSTPRNFFYSGGVFDASWIPWIHNSIAPDIRPEKGPSRRQDGRGGQCHLGIHGVRDAPSSASRQPGGAAGCRALLLRVARAPSRRSLVGLGRDPRSTTTR